MKKSDEESLELAFGILFLFGMGLYQLVKAICKAVGGYAERNARFSEPEEECPSLKVEPFIFHGAQFH